VYVFIIKTKKSSDVRLRCSRSFFFVFEFRGAGVVEVKKKQQFSS